MITIAAAVASNGCIGREGKIPWPRIAEDRDRLHDLWRNKMVVMGRKTYESIPGHARPVQCYVLASWPSAIRLHLGSLLGWYADRGVEVVVAGGASVYDQAMPHAGRMELTLVHEPHEGDAFFRYNPEEWVETARQDREGYSFVTLERKKS